MFRPKLGQSLTAVLTLRGFDDVLGTSSLKMTSEFDGVLGTSSTKMTENNMLIFQIVRHCQMT